MKESPRIAIQWHGSCWGECFALIMQSIVFLFFLCILSRTFYSAVLAISIPSQTEGSNLSRKNTKKLIPVESRHLWGLQLVAWAQVVTRTTVLVIFYEDDNCRVPTAVSAAVRRRFPTDQSKWLGFFFIYSRILQSFSLIYGLSCTVHAFDSHMDVVGGGLYVSISVLCATLCLLPGVFDFYWWKKWCGLWEFYGPKFFIAFDYYFIALRYVCASWQSLDGMEPLLHYDDVCRKRSNDEIECFKWISLLVDGKQCIDFADCATGDPSPFGRKSIFQRNQFSVSNRRNAPENSGKNDNRYYFYF